MDGFLKPLLIMYLLNCEFYILHVCLELFTFAGCTEHTKTFMLLCMIKKSAHTKPSLEEMKTMVLFCFPLTFRIGLKQ